MNILLVILVLVVLIVVHELGHFLVAKWRGVKVEEFGIGYPPRLMVLKKTKETEYTLNWLPFGGFVKLFGEERGNKQDGSYDSASNLSKGLILVAGVFANILLAWLLFVGGFLVGMPTPVPDGTKGAMLVVSSVLPESPAKLAGFLRGDEILSVKGDGKYLNSLTPTAMSEFIASMGGQKLSIKYKRSNLIQETELIPVHAVIDSEFGRPAIGVALVQVANKKLSMGNAFIEAGKQTAYSVRSVIFGFYSIFSGMFTGGANIKNLIGPVGLARIVGDATSQNIGQFLALFAFISINLSIINLIPIPALDGGRLLFVGIEAVIKREIPRMFEQITNAFGFGLIIILMVVVSYNDIVRIFN